MFNTILVPLDGTPLVERSLPYARVLARSTGAGVALVHPVRLPYYGGADVATAAELTAAAETYLRDVAQPFVTAGVAVQTDVADGEVRDVVWRAVEQFLPDLVVHPLPLHAGLRDWVWSAEAVLAQTSQPTLLVPSWGGAGVASDMADAPRLLVPLDGSVAAEAALPCALALARCLGGEIVLQRATTPALTVVWPGVGDAQPTEMRVPAQTSEATLYLDRIAADLQRAGCRVRIDVRSGWPAEAITQAGLEHGAALVIMAINWQPYQRQQRLGAMVRGVLRHGGVPLLVVKASAALAQTPAEYVHCEASHARSPLPTRRGWGEDRLIAAGWRPGEARTPRGEERGAARMVVRLRTVFGGEEGAQERRQPRGALLRELPGGA